MADTCDQYIAFQADITQWFPDMFCVGIYDKLQCLCLSFCNIVQCQCCTCCILHGTDITDNRIAAEFFRADHTAKAKTVLHTVIFHMTDFRDYLWHSTCLRIQRNNHIHLIHAGHGYNGVTIMDAFTFKQKLAAGIPMYDTYFRWKFTG